MLMLLFAGLVVVYLCWRVWVSVRRLDPLPQEASFLLCVLLVLLNRMALGRWLSGLPRPAAIALLVAELAVLCVLWWWVNRTYNRWAEKQREELERRDSLGDRGSHA